MCCTELLNKSGDLSQCLGVHLIYFRCNSGCIPKAFNKDVDCCSVIVKSTSLCFHFEVMDVGSQSFIVLFCISINHEVQVWIFALQNFNLRMPLILSQHFPVWVTLWMSVQVRPCDLARYVQLSISMSVAVSMSMNQSSNFEESSPSNVGISWSMVVVRLDSLLCCAQGVCVCLHGFVHWLLNGLGGRLE